MMKVTTGLFGQEPENWDLKVDLSFGPAADWQLEVWQHCIDTLPPQMLMYGTDTFWPVDPEVYREQYLQPQLGLFETAATTGHIVQEGSPAREEYRKHDLLPERLLPLAERHKGATETAPGSGAYRGPQRPPGTLARVELRAGWAGTLPRRAVPGGHDECAAGREGSVYSLLRVLSSYKQTRVGRRKGRGLDRAPGPLRVSVPAELPYGVVTLKLQLLILLRPSGSLATTLTVWLPWERPSAGV